MPSRAEVLISFIYKYFAEAKVRTCYEAGYSGFWLHRELELAGISNIVVHAAHVEVEAGNRVKTDKRDSLKLAEQLAARRLGGIRIPSEEQEYHRLLTRTREQLMRARRRVQVQIRMKLHQFGLFPSHIERAIRPKDVEELLLQLKSEELKLTIQILYSVWLNRTVWMSRAEIQKVL
jgi:transposase